MKKHANFRFLALMLTIIANSVFVPKVTGAETLCKQHWNESFQIITGGTPASNGLVSGQSGVKIWLKGNLTIDQNFAMYSWVVKADPGTAIILNNSVELSADFSDFFSCDGMWNGISLLGAGKLTLSNCRVQDAETAISTRASCTLSLTSNQFDRNKYGVYSFSSSYSFLDLAKFEGNSFTCSTPRNDAATYSDAGFYTYSTLASIGDVPTNSFVNQTSGFYLSRSDFQIQSCKFTNCNSGIELVNKSTLQQKGLGKFSQVPTFRNCIYGIKSKSSGFISTENYVLEFGQYAFFAEGQATSAVIIADNRLEDYDYYGSFTMGVRFMHITPYHDRISNNQFEIHGDLDYCIALDNAYHNYGGVNIEGNNFLIDFEINELVEMRLPNCNGSLIFQNNTLDVPHNLGQTWGFHFHDAAYLSQHHVEGNKIAAAHLRNGFFCQSGALNFCHNEASGALNGFEFSANCLGTVLSESQVGPNTTGVLIQDRIGQQNLLGNCWDDISNYSVKAVQCNGSTPLASLFTVDGSIPCHFPAGSIQPPSLFDPSGTNFTPCAAGLVENINGWDLQIANGSISQTTTSPLEIWDARRYLFRKLYLHPDLKPFGSQAEAFYQAHAAGKIGEFHQAELAVRAAGVMPGGLMSQHEAALAGLFAKLQEVASLNGQLVIQPNNAIFQAQRDSAIASALLYADDLESVHTSADNAIQAQTNAALSSLTALTCENSWQQNEKTVRYLSLLCASQGARDFTETELDQLRDIAEQCPEQGGDFVLLARAFVMYAEGQGCYEPSPEDYNCSSPLPLKRPSNGITTAA